MRDIRKEVRVLGIDDGPFYKFRRGRVLVVGALFRGGKCMDGFLSTTAKVDGTDATRNIERMIVRSKFYSQIRCVLLDGVTVGGFNVIDITALFAKTKIPVIAVIRKKPDVPFILETLRMLGLNVQAKVIEKLPSPVRVGRVYVQYVGLSLARVREFIKVTTTYADIPEPLRIAHIVAGGLVKGESRGRA